MIKLRSFVSLFCLITIIFASSASDGPIKLHVFLHSHLDEGWRNTFESYYTGPGTQDGGCVSCAFNNVFESLAKNSDRKYQIAEVAFVKRWWSDQSATRKAQFRKYLDQKQVEFINGGWSANDEACAYYEDIVDNFILGHRWLKSEFSLDTNVGWQLDSFGHSATHAAIMAQAGYDGLFFGRIDYQDWDKRREEKTLEVNWRPQNPHNESVFAHVLYTHYSDTKFMINDNYWCRSIFCNGNLNPNQINQVSDWIHKQSNSFPTKNIAMLVGDDFHLWRESEKDFVGIENMIQAFDASPDKGIKAKFSTLSEYVAEVQQDLLSDPKHLPLPEKYGDFFPYIENEFTAWVGYYTSKPMFKLKVRETSQYYNAAKLLLAKFMLQDNPDVLPFDETIHHKIDQALNHLEDPLGVVQHHDAVSGTMKEHVKQDYERLLNSGKDTVNQEILSILKAYSQELLGDAADYSTPIDFNWRQRDPGLVTIFNQNKNVLINVFNPGERDKFLIKIKVPTFKYKVLDETNNYLPADIMCNAANAESDCYIYFVDEIAAYSLKNYIISPSTLSKRVIPQDITEDVEISIKNQAILNIDSNLMDFDYSICESIESGNLNARFSDRKCIQDSFNLNYEYYESHVGSGLHVSSGAYIFSPKSDNKHELSKIIYGRVFRGRYLTMVQIMRDDLRTDVSIIHHEIERGIVIESYLNPVTGAQNGKEIVVMIRSKNITNDDLTFYTDENGYYMQKRRINHRDDFESHTSVPIPSNYYPINSAIFIQDEKSGNRLTIMTDRAQGATSYNKGEIEIMIHRLTIRDDWKGLDETLWEQDPDGGSLLKVSTRHILMLSSEGTNLKSSQRKNQYKLDRPLQFWFGTTIAHDFSNPTFQEQSMSLDLKDNIKLYIRSYMINEYVVRLHNLDENTSKTVDIYDLESKLCTLLNNFAGKEYLKVSSITELYLFTTKEKSEIKKNVLDPKAPDTKNLKDGQDLSSIQLLPMEIRTFNITLAH